MFKNFRSYDIVILASPLYYNGPAIDITKACSNARKCPNNKKHKKAYRLSINYYCKLSIDKLSFLYISLMKNCSISKQ